MPKRTRMLIVVGAALLAASPLLLAGEGHGRAAQPETQMCMAMEQGLGLESELAGPSAKPVPGAQCLPSEPLTCAQMPIPQGGSCSCTSVLLPKKCKSCSGGKGQELSTTCTVHVPCTNQPCDISQNYSRTGRSCAS